MAIGEIKQIALAVGDIHTSMNFYGATLGLQFLFEAPPKMAFYNVGGIRLMLSEAKEINPGGPILYFSVDNIDEAYGGLGEAGVACIRKPLLTHKTENSELWLAFFTDPDGHTLALMEERTL